MLARREASRSARCSRPPTAATSPPAAPTSPASDSVWLVKTDANGNVAYGTRKGQLPGTTTEQAGALTATTTLFRQRHQRTGRRRPPPIPRDGLNPNHVDRSRGYRDPPAERGQDRPPGELDAPFRRVGRTR